MIPGPEDQAGADVSSAPAGPAAFDPPEVALPVDPALVLDAFSDAVVAADGTGRVVYANRLVASMLGWAAEDLLGRPLETLVPPRLRPRHRQAFERYVATREPRLIGRSVRLPALHREGHELDVELTLTALHTDDGDVVVGSIRDLRGRVQEAEQRFRSLVDNVDAIVWEADPHTFAFTYVSRRAESILGYEPAMWVGQIDTWSQVVHPDDRELVIGAWHDAVATGEERQVECRVRAADDRYVWLRTSLFVARDESGEPAVVRGLMVDVTDDRERDLRRETQHRATEALAAASRLEDAAPAVMEAVCELLDWDLGTLWLVEPGSDDLVAVSSYGRPDHPGVGVFQEYNRHARFRRGEGLPGHAWAEGRPIWVNDLATDERFPRRPVAEEAGLHTAFCFPIVVRGAVLGTMEFLATGVREPDLDLIGVLTSIGGHIGQFVERWRTEGDLRQLSHTLQKSLLPPELPIVPGVEVAVRYHPAGRSIQVGGDFYDVFDIGAEQDEWGVVIGDVCGKGAEAASLTALARYSARAATVRARRPSVVLATVNEAILRHDTGDRFCTVAYGRLVRAKDPGRWHLTVACGGHPVPMVVRRDGRVEDAGCPGMLLGIVSDVDTAETDVVLEPGDTVVFFTDGVTEARSDDGELYGVERVRALLATCAGLRAEETATRIETAVLEFQDGEPRDDVALLVLTVAP